ncbi:MAG: polysaccharide biosynthesis protein [Oscillospiraceae bacterium]|nr:polysaccharide biosynthesis protein [Oscillospiraceae bacterium]
MKQNKHPSILRSPKSMRVAFLVALDLLLMNVASILALLMLENFNWTRMMNQSYMGHIINYTIISSIGTILIFIPFKLYNSLWQFASIDELMHIVVAGAIVSLVKFIFNQIKVTGYFPVSYPLISGILLICFVGISRLSYRMLRSVIRPESAPSKVRTLLIGGGNAGAMALREFQTSEKSTNHVLCIVDDDYSKRGSFLRGVKVVGNRNDIPAIVDKYRIEEIVLAIPTASAKDKRDILKICQQTRCRLKTLPGLYQLANGDVSLQKIRDVDVLDLLGRDSVEVDLTEIADYIRGKTVLVTGGGGSIGSELCRQIAKNDPERLIIFDIYENNAYDIQQELKRSIPGLNLTTLIGSVRDKDRVEMVFSQYHPDLVFHAAAHKHVPLMEESPNEAVKNNVFGTLNVALAADKYKAKRFVLISTDKAVNPTNIMGATKRICEMIVQIMSNRSETIYVAVRFGNVLGSNGSVIPLFKKQIAEGGPVTVTHKDIIRYFMTIPEAVSLVLQAGAFARRGEIFVLDMGEPVHIDDLARNMIRLSGLEPGVDIEIKYTGLRPGEKLYEEMLMKEEGLRTTANALIHIGKPLELDEERFHQQLAKLHQACEENSPHIKEQVAEIVKTYQKAPVAV